jgi:hypothetical protein
MELYEIIRISTYPCGNYICTSTNVITATMDKDMAEKMLIIYKQNQNEDESYQLRTLREPEIRKW